MEKEKEIILPRAKVVRIKVASHRREKEKERKETKARPASLTYHLHHNRCTPLGAELTVTSMEYRL